MSPQEERRALLVGHDDLGVLQDDREAVRDRLQLQRDVGHDADHRDDRDQAAEQLALAVARGDEVGDRGDAVRLADADDLAQHVPPQRRHQRRAEVDRQEADAARRRAPDAAVERPGGAVDRERQRVDVRVGDDAAARRRRACRRSRRSRTAARRRANDARTMTVAVSTGASVRQPLGVSRCAARPRSPSSAISERPGEEDVRVERAARRGRAPRPSKSDEQRVVEQQAARAGTARPGAVP